jgi:undecaprenyl-diphosphatase
MDLTVAVKALVMGLVEGLTEFLPVSSTGHLVVVGSLLNWNDEKGKLFEIVVQLSAILAVCWHYRGRLWHVAGSLASEAPSRRLVLNLALAFLPAALLGVAFSGFIKRYLFAPMPVALAFIIGGILILIIEHNIGRPRVTDVDSVKPRDALWVGVAQSLSLIPGTSRSGATIMGGLLRGLSRRTATEFSFFLAIPTMFAATGYELFKARHSLQMNDFAVIGVGSIASFISAAFAVSALLKYVSGHDFRIFAWYRIVAGIAILASWHFQWIHWQGA